MKIKKEVVVLVYFKLVNGITITTKIRNYIKFTSTECRTTKLRF